VAYVIGTIGVIGVMGVIGVIGVLRVVLISDGGHRSPLLLQY
jgi:hypothetical protein